MTGGWLAGRVGAPRLILTGGIMAALGALALPLAGPDSPLFIALYLLGAGAGRGITTVGLGSIQARVFPGKTLGRISGLLEIGFGMGGLAGPWLTAAARDATGSYVPGIITAAPAALLVAVGGLAAWRTRSKERARF
jgi:MFS family permease